MNELRTVKLSGVLAKKFGHVHRIAVSSVAEAARALCVTVPGFEKFLMESKDRGLAFAVHVGRENVGEDRLKEYVGSDDQIRISPVVMGSKNSGIISIVLGVVLIAVGVLIQGTPLGFLSPYLYTAGIGLIAGGVVQLLIPGPKAQKNRESPENQTSDIFNGPVNVQAQGNPVPLFYGEMYVGSVVVSAGISVEDNYVVPVGTGGVGTGRAGGGFSGDVLSRYNNAAQ